MREGARRKDGRWGNPRNTQPHARGAHSPSLTHHHKPRGTPAWGNPNTPVRDTNPPPSGYQIQQLPKNHYRPKSAKRTSQSRTAQKNWNAVFHLNNCLRVPTVSQLGATWTRRVWFGTAVPENKYPLRYHCPKTKASFCFCKEVDSATPSHVRETQDILHYSPLQFSRWLHFIVIFIKINNFLEGVKKEKTLNYTLLENSKTAKNWPFPLAVTSYLVVSLLWNKASSVAVCLCRAIASTTT